MSGGSFSSSQLSLEAALSQAEQAFLSLFQKYPQGLNDDILSTELAHIPLIDRVATINTLSKKGLLTLFRVGNSVAYQEVKSEEVLKLQGLGMDERLVYQYIKQSDNTGIWTKDLRVKSNLQPAQLTKILKTLESKKIVKSVKSVENKNKKLYMLFDIEPSRKITGGAWYSEQEFDSEFIEMLQKQSLNFISSKSFPKNKDDIFPHNYEGYASAEEVHAFIMKLGVSRVKLDVEDIRCILETLIYDGKVEQVNGRYKAVRIKPFRNPLTDVPCGSCPVFKFCTPSGPVNPSTCEYFTRWLSIDYENKDKDNKDKDKDNKDKDKDNKDKKD